MDEIVEGTVGTLHILAREAQSRSSIRALKCVSLFVQVNHTVIKQIHGQTAAATWPYEIIKDYILTLFQIYVNIYSRFFVNFHLIVIQSLNL